MLSNDNFFALLPVATDMWGLGADAVNLVAMPLFHIGGGGWAVAGMYEGARSVIVRELDPAALVQLIPAEGVTHAFLVPAVLQFMLMVPGVDDADFSSLDTLVYGASPISEEVLARSIATFGARFWQAYGLTETTGAVVNLAPEDHDLSGPNRHRLRSCGVAGPGVELRIVDPETQGRGGRPARSARSGSRSPQVMKGYWNNDAATAEAVDAEGWFRSGDAGYLDEDGYLYIHDRVKDMIVSGGENVYPAEVENVLMSHDGIADVAVIGVPHEQLGRDGQGDRRHGRRPRSDRRRDHRLRPRAARPLQVPDERRLHRRPAAQPERQGAQEGPPGAVLGRAGAPGQLTTAAPPASRPVIANRLDRAGSHDSSSET